MSEATGHEGTRAQVVVAGAVAGLVSRYVQIQHSPCASTHHVQALTMCKHSPCASTHHVQALTMCKLDCRLTDTTASFCIAPLDVVKIRLQLQSHSPSSHAVNAHNSPMYKGTLATLQTILRQEGLTGLWKGNVPAEALYLTYGAIQFLAYRSATQAIDDIVSPSHRLPATAVSFAAGAIAGTLATTVTYPLDLLRTRFAAQGNERVYMSLRSSIRDIARNEGPKGFFRGLGAGVGQIVPYMGLFFAFYESLKPRLSSVCWMPLHHVGSGDAIAGVLASVMSKTVVFPLDTVRKRLQVQGPTRGSYVHKNIPAYDSGVVRTMTCIVAREGVRSLYRGLTVGLVKAAPASAVTMWTYERTIHSLQSFDMLEGKE
jgi:solute carrier family 25 thiamine pyrophosphate transporter 19